MTESSDAIDSGPELQVTSPVHRFAQLIDHGIYRAEVALVAIASLVMTAGVTLAIVERSFKSEESLLAKKLLALTHALFGIEKSAENLEFFTGVIAPICLLLVAFFLGRAIVFASLKERGRAPNRMIGIGAGLLGIVMAKFMIYLVLEVSSRWMCTGLIALGCAIWFWSALKRRSWLDMGLACLFCVGGYQGCATLKAGYLWVPQVALMLLAWLAFLGASMATREGRHIQVDALSKLVPQKFRPWTRAIGLLLTTFFTAYLLYLSHLYLFGENGSFHQEVNQAAESGLPPWAGVMSVFVSFGLMSIRFAALTIDAFVHRRIVEKGLVH